MGNKMTSKHFAVKRTIEGRNTTVDFVPKVKTTVCPTIAESFVDDAGEIQHILSNGNVLSEANYIKFWGKRNGVINWQAKPERVNPNPFVIK